MKMCPYLLPHLDDTSLEAVTGGMFPRVARMVFTHTEKLNPGAGADAYLMPGGIRDHERACAQARFDALVKQNPGLFAPPDPNYSVNLLQQRLANGYGKPHLVRGGNP
ncbi:hypothetical protein [Mesoterricola silvestris]|uniref:Uncharacterized protein n=1 Tax=Mesoterricola silvestris TaxID=2927979 RepID=A0AA48GVR5_9BACT|nr:hypothetical protein [Mesoterricola silvestris]BDU74957.1 hypothetical protein METEAL_41310 [Mesoterricola silvestris]